MGVRQRILRQQLTEASLARAFHRLLPRRNSYCPVNYPELLDELLYLERRRIFFGWEGLARLILELEFGDRYREFADRRDHTTSGAAAGA